MLFKVKDLYVQVAPSHTQQAPACNLGGPINPQGFGCGCTLNCTCTCSGTCGCSVCSNTLFTEEEQGIPEMQYLEAKLSEALREVQSRLSRAKEDQK